MMHAVANGCAPWAAELSDAVAGAAAAWPRVKSSDVCVVRAVAGERVETAATETAVALACALRGHASWQPRSYTIVLLEQGIGGRRGIDAAQGGALARRRARLDERATADAAARVAPLLLPANCTSTMCANSRRGGSGPVTVLWASEAPSVRTLSALPRGRCGVLALRVDGSSANLRHSLRVDLPHMLRLAAPDAVVLGVSAAACTRTPSNVSVRTLDLSRKYAGPFGSYFAEQCRDTRASNHSLRSLARNLESTHTH
jgi:hypothetical protein